MTRDEIIAKWAGLSAREKDAWVAEVVFGWEWWEPDGEDAGWYERLSNAPFYDRVFTGRRRGWSPSMDISAAWAVLEALNETHWVSVMRIAGEVNTTGNYVAEIGEYTAGSNSAPEAICLAALIAKLTEVSADVAV